MCQTSRVWQDELVLRVPPPVTRLTVYRRLYIYRHQRIYTRRKDSGPTEAETIYAVRSFFRRYLRINVFVWARVVYMARYGCCASHGCSVVSRKIHMTKIRRDQHRMHDDHFDGFSVLRPFHKEKVTFHGPGVRAAAQWKDYTWFEELVQREILYRHQRIFTRREDSRPTEAETIYAVRFVFRAYLRINVFVWARVVYVARYGCCASYGCSGKPGAKAPSGLSSGTFNSASTSWHISDLFMAQV